MQNMQQNMIQQNMLNMMKQMQNTPLVFDPNKIHNRTKQAWISQNITQCRTGIFAKFYKSESVVCNYNPQPPIGQIDNICDVSVVYEHSIDVAEKYAEIGVNNYSKMNNLNPVIVNVVGRDFTGSNYESCSEMRDETINIRTSLCFHKTKGNIFPLKEEQCAYTNLAIVIRPKNHYLMGNQQFLNWQNAFRVGIITSSPIKHDSTTKKLPIKSYLPTLANIETIFQCAIAMSHFVLILCPYGHTSEDNNPVDDIIKLYNFCIMKYGHKFKHIIIAVPPHYPKQIFEMYSEKITKPHDIVKEIDDKYTKIESDLEMKLKLQENLKNKVPNTPDLTENISNNTNNNINNIDMSKIDPNQLQMFMQMMNMMNKKN
jgi:hypothetical protein